MSLIEVNDEIFIIWVFYSWLEIVFLILKSYWCNNSHINHIRVINIEHVQLKLLTFKNDLVLMSISEVFFIVEVIASIMCEGISDIVDCSWLIDNIEIEFWEEFISVDLTAVELTGSGEVFQIFIISKHGYRVSSIINLKTSFFKCFDNGQ